MKLKNIWNSYFIYTFNYRHLFRHIIADIYIVYEYAGNGEDKVAFKVLVDISEVRDEVVVAEKTEAPVSKTE